MRHKKATIPNALRQQVLERDGHKCRYCGSSSGTMHIDHVYPESEGGKTVIGNLVAACASCNHRKHNKIGQWPPPANTEPKKSIVRAENTPAFSLSLVLMMIGMIIGAIGVLGFFGPLTDIVSIGLSTGGVGLIIAITVWTVRR